MKFIIFLLALCSWLPAQNIHPTLADPTGLAVVLNQKNQFDASCFWLTPDPPTQCGTVTVTYMCGITYGALIRFFYDCEGAEVIYSVHFIGFPLSSHTFNVPCCASSMLCQDPNGPSIDKGAIISPQN